LKLAEIGHCQLIRSITPAGCLVQDASDQLSRNTAFSITVSAYCCACNHNWSQIHQHSFLCGFPVGSGISSRLSVLISATNLKSNIMLDYPIVKC